jgi:hypothetical protein
MAADVAVDHGLRRCRLRKLEADREREWDQYEREAP